LQHNDNHEQKQTGFVWKPKDAHGLVQSSAEILNHDKTLKPMTPDKNSTVANCLRSNGALCATDNSIII
jgi:hypothetical protein